MQKLWQDLIEFIFPSHCIGCKTRGIALCPVCISKIPPADPFPKDWIRSIFYYKDPTIKKALWALKYKNKKEVGKILGIHIYEYLLEDVSDLELFSNIQTWTVVPIPISKRRLKKRGYNQAAILTESLCAQDAGQIFIFSPHALQKIKDIQSQAETKNRTERLKNILGSFAVKDPEKITGKNIILVDDIVTTGATLTEARRVLKEAGAKKIIAVTVAH